MDEAPKDTKLLLLMVLLAIWVFVFGASVQQLLAAASDFATKDPQAWDPQNFKTFLGLQLVAGLCAFAISVIGLSWPKGSGVRKIAIVPILAAFLIGMPLLILG